MSQPLSAARERFVSWLSQRVSDSALGADETRLLVDPDGRFFLGRLAPETAVLNRGLGERGERLDPCAVGVALRPDGHGPWHFKVEVECVVWVRAEDEGWDKVPVGSVEVSVDVPPATRGEWEFGADALAHALAEAVGEPLLAAAILVEIEPDIEGAPVVIITIVNRSPDGAKSVDTNLYEVCLTVVGPSTPFVLMATPDTFRYDRIVPAYGVNCGVRVVGDRIETLDLPGVDKVRPTYWGSNESVPDLRFMSLAADPLPALRDLVGALKEWGGEHWADEVLARRATSEGWTDEVHAAAREGAEAFTVERERLERGLELLATDAVLLRAFKLMNEAISHSARVRGYDGWRPFQIGFLLANIASVASPSEESDIADIVWFATGGGKTETYLGLLVTAALHDRLGGKVGGITAWSRFPLRMLSLQQTQRFADALAGAELIRRRENIPGAPFSLGFFVGDRATPNRILEKPSDGQFDADDDEAVAAAQVLLYCPFCRGDLAMGFSHRFWRLEHRCTNEECSWLEEALPFYIVDEEIYRFLPTVVVGTLDKAAIIGWQAAMRGFIGPPLGRCSELGHGYCYAKRSTRPIGCLVPGCSGKLEPLDFEADRFPPSFRLQDELHLLKDSLGAVDANYEALFDSIQLALTGTRPKILASSATLVGYAKQVDALYRREGRVFPTPGPAPGVGFWSQDSESFARRFLAVAPRGVTTEFAIDRMITVLQTAIRDFIADPARLCSELGIDVSHADSLISDYGVTVVYGNTLRDLEAVARSIETQLPFQVNTAELTGNTEFDLVRKTLERLEHPEGAFEDRVHVVTASAMMSHGVDIDRLNVMIVIGLPLTASEFIQATARVGRSMPGLVFVLHKIARERDAGVYRSFSQFVSQTDRFVEPVAVTRRSRRVLERTLPGIGMGRLWAIHEPRSHRALTTVARLRDYFRDNDIRADDETAAIIEALELTEPLDEGARRTVEDWVTLYFQNLADPALGGEFPSRVLPWAEDGPMRSLRDVDEQLGVRD